MRLNKVEFCSTIDAFEEMYRKNSDLASFLGVTSEWIFDDWINDVYGLIDVLCDLPAEEYSETVLDWYCFETDFGRVNNVRTIIDSESGEEVDCTINNSEDLYNYILKAYQDEQE